ncbi:hypothetical protein V9K67_03305 [Paraflavisolibacter sp. H34]|uniref:hypothetical protein n=1 Tax=Huijunlia imazamoxiresistens TaxID=3127457 RepID=UPI00301A92BF
MMSFRCLLFLVCFLGTGTAFAQRIVYSEPDRGDSRRMNFEVIGKISGNFLVYKNVSNKNYISLYDNDMNQVERVEQTYIPGDRLINIDFFAYPDFVYLVYQYQKRNVVYCEAMKVNGAGKRMSEVITLDTTHIGFAANNKIYSSVASEDKSKILVFKINSRNRSNYVVTTLLFDEALALKKRSVLNMPMDDSRDDHLNNFFVDNEGDAVFTKFSRTANDAVSKAQMVWKPAQADSFTTVDVPLDKIYLDELHIKVDNANKRYFLTSFYYKQRRGNIDGFYFYTWDKQTRSQAMQNTIALSEELRNEARGDAGMKSAFNDYFIRNIIVKRDGGFIIGSEAYYTTSRYNNWNRWNYMYGMPYYNTFDYYSFYPSYGSWWYRNQYYNNQAVRHHADNITILSFDNTGKLQWSDVIHKQQFDDEAGDQISYQIVNTGGQIHFIFNLEDKRTLLLNDYVLSPDGQINRNPTLKNLDKGYEFLTKYGKQVSSKQIIIPCYYRNYICFAKIDFNQ